MVVTRVSADYRGPAAGIYVVVRTSCRYICSDGGQGRQQGLGPTMDSLTAVGRQLLLCTTMAAGSCHGCMAVKASDGGWARGMQMSSWRGLAAGESSSTGQ